jgi:hypothetical protein
MDPEKQAGCGILFHQRPMLQNMSDLESPVGALFFMSWILTPDEELTDASLAEATTAVNGQNLVFLKALVDGTPEIINVELPDGEHLRADMVRQAEPVICVHYTNDPASGFYCRTISDLRILAPIRSWKLRASEGGEAGAAST